MKSVKDITKEGFASYIDHSVIGPGVPEGEVEKYCREAIQNNFACVYVNGCDTLLAKKLLSGTPVHVGVPVGYPGGVMTTGVKLFEGLEAIDSGADELDVVINVSMLKRKNYEYVQNELNTFVAKMREKKSDIIVKVIIEAPMLTREEKIKACEMVAASGADYVKQSTGVCHGYSYVIGDIQLMKSVVGDRVKVKASGAMSGIEDAITCIAYGAERIGNDEAMKWMQQFEDRRI